LELKNPQVNRDHIKYNYYIVKKDQVGPEFINLVMDQEKINVNQILPQIALYEKRKAATLEDLKFQLETATQKKADLIDVPSLKTKKFNVDITTYFIEAIYNDFQDAPSDLYALDLFAHTTTFDAVPFVRLTYQEQTYTRASKQLPQLLKNNEFKLEFEDYPMVAVVQSSTGYENIYFQFSETSNRFKIIFNALANKTLQNVLDQLFNALPALTKYSQQELNVRGDFQVDDINVNPLVLSDLTFNNPLFSRHMYMDEISSTVSKKARVSLHYPLPMNQKILFMINNVGDNASIRISKAPNTDAIHDFIPVIGKLLALYKTEKQSVINEYKVFGIDLETAATRVKHKDIQVKEKSKAKILSKAVPDLFVADYARHCQKKLQPTIIDEDEADETDNQVMKFPNQEDGKYYICENKEYPFPGLKVNVLANKDTYPYIPCCFKTQQLLFEGSWYSRYMQNLDPTKIMKRDISHLITTLKIIDVFDRNAALPKLLNEWLTVYLGGEYQRKGTIQGPLNMVHAVLRAVDNSYSFLQTVDERNEYAENFLSTALKTINIECCKQSNYELTISKLTQLWLDPKKFHDIARFVRIMELSFPGTKVLVLSPDEIMVPRFIDFYARTPIKSDDRVVLLFNHQNHNEVIVDSTGNTFFTGVKATKLYEIYEKAVSFIQIKDANIDATPLQGVTIDKALIFYKPEIIKPKLQYIDGYGKARAIIFDYEGNETIMQIPPSMPYNLPSIEL